MESQLLPENKSMVEDITKTVMDTAINKGAMGLTQSFAAIGNASAMVVMIAVFIASLFYVSSLHHSGMTQFQNLHQEGLGLMQKMIDRQEKQMFDQEFRHQDERRRADEVINKNTSAIERLADSNNKLIDEVRLSRIDRIQRKEKDSKD